MIRNETFSDGVCIYAEVIDLDGRTFSIENNGETVSTRPLTDDEVAAHTPTEDLRAAAIAKLMALGLTEQEALALIGAP